jgi:hypothetical protein
VFCEDKPNLRAQAIEEVLSRLDEEEDKWLLTCCASYSKLLNRLSRASTLALWRNACASKWAREMQILYCSCFVFVLTLQPPTASSKRNAACTLTSLLLQTDWGHGWPFLVSLNGYPTSWLNLVCMWSNRHFVKIQQICFHFFLLLSQIQQSRCNRQCLHRCHICYIQILLLLPYM